MDVLVREEELEYVCRAQVVNQLAKQVFGALRCGRHRATADLRDGRGAHMVDHLGTIYALLQEGLLHEGEADLDGDLASQHLQVEPVMLAEEEALPDQAQDVFDASQFYLAQLNGRRAEKLGLDCLAESVVVVIDKLLVEQGLALHKETHYVSQLLQTRLRLRNQVEQVFEAALLAELVQQGD